MLNSASLPVFADGGQRTRVN